MKNKTKYILFSLLIITSFFVFINLIMVSYNIGVKFSSMRRCGLNIEKYGLVEIDKKKYLYVKVSQVRESVSLLLLSGIHYGEKEIVIAEYRSGLFMKHNDNNFFKASNPILIELEKFSEGKTSIFTLGIDDKKVKILEIIKNKIEYDLKEVKFNRNEVVGYF